MEVIEGILEGIVFRNEINGYTVAVLDDEFTVVGCMPDIQEGHTVRLTGDWIEHKRYGRQFNVVDYELIMPRNEDEMLRYLGAGVIKGVGPSTAEAIIRCFGMNAFDALKDPKLLQSVPGIGKARAQLISESYRDNEEMRECIMFFQKYGLTVGKAIAIYRVFGSNAVSVAQDNPYMLIERVEGLGFKTVDKMALTMGIAPDDEARLRSAIKNVLYEASQEGHVYLPAEMLLNRTAQATEVALTDEQISEMMSSRGIVCEDAENSPVYLNYCYEAEGDIAYRLKTIAINHNRLPAHSLTTDISEFERVNCITLAEEQKNAVRAAVSEGVFVLTGGPGTGKTTTLNCIIGVLEKYGLKVVLAAPTGRAAKRMTETTGINAKTIHRLLEYSFAEDGAYFARNFNNPLEGDVFIIDEMSMVDIHLMRALMFAIPDSARVILVGDADQLPSIGPGCVLRDIIESNCIQVTRLEEIFRQSKDSVIVENAHRINKGIAPLMDNSYSDFKLVSRSKKSDIVSTIVKLCVETIPEKYGLTADDIQVLSPNKKQEDGVHNLNKLLQAQINPPDKFKHEKKTGQEILRVGDRVMQIRNNYQLAWRKYFSPNDYEEGEGVFNGDMGKIERIYDDVITVRFDDDRVVEYDAVGVEDIVNAYAISIHKSQGCEFPCVVIPISYGSPFLYNRNLLYTAVTRAKELVVLVGTAEAVNRMVQNISMQRRFSRLSHRIKTEFGQVY